MELIRHDTSNALLPETGLSKADLDGIAGDLIAAREEVLQTDLQLWSDSDSIPEAKQPLDAGFIELPERLLAEYEERRDTSELGQILATARELRDAVDRVVVLGIGGSYMGARALMEACCPPYFNELSRGERAGHPRMYFEGNNFDNDATQGLLSLLSSEQQPRGLEQRWAIVVVSKSGATRETAVALRQFLAALRKSCGGSDEQVARLVVPVTGTSGRLFELAKALGCRSVHRVPDGVGGRYSVFSAVGLLPAAILGLDVVQLLRGAAAMTDHLRNTDPGNNVVLDYVGVCHSMETLRGASIRVLSVWSKALEACGLWYDQLLAESLGKHERGATPITAVNTRDLHSRAQQHQEGRRDKLFTNLIVERWRCDPLAVGHSEQNQDELNELSQKTLPELMSAAVAGTNQAYREAGRPTIDIHLPRLNEHVMGQLLQMFMLATAVEGRLIDINPYGQPGVEAYKRNMNRILGA